MNLRVNIGCGKSPTNGYVNIDNSLSIKLANFQFLYKIMKFLKILNPQQIENIEWNKKHKIIFSDVTKKIPINNNAAECIYTSHMLEHLSRNGVKIFLKEAHRVLNENGVLRIVVPDLASPAMKTWSSSKLSSFFRKIYFSISNVISRIN